MKNTSMLLLLSLFCSTSYAATSTDLVKSTASWNGSPLPTINLSSPEVTVKEITIQPHEVLPIHLHPVINAGVLLSGSLTVYSEDKKQSLHLKANTPQNSIVEMVNQYHYGVNDGDTPAKIIVFYIANKGQKVTMIKEKS